MKTQNNLDEATKLAILLFNLQGCTVNETTLEVFNSIGISVGFLGECFYDLKTSKLDMTFRPHQPLEFITIDIKLESSTPTGDEVPATDPDTPGI